MHAVGHIKTVAKNGQISLGKKFAGKQIQVYEEDDGTIIIKTVVVVPENELWLYRGDSIERLDKAIAWAESTPRRNNFEEIIAKVENVQD
jgi:hypothetical protein